MPQASRLETREQEILDKLRNRPRLEGLHSTDCIYCNIKAWAAARLAAVGEIIQYDEETLLNFLAGSGIASIIEEGHVHQIEAIAPDVADVGTLDIWWRDHPCEIKVSQMSTLRDVLTMEHWMEQLGEYVWRTFPRDRKRDPWGELWILHLLGDHGKKRCPEHGVPQYEDGEQPFKRRYPDTNRDRLCCPIDGCWVFLEDGQRRKTLRCHRIDFTWEELDSLHAIHAWRQPQLQDDIKNPDYAIGNLPPIRWGYQAAFECASCWAKEKIGCPGVEGVDDLEAELAGSIVELRARRQPSREIEFIP